MKTTLNILLILGSPLLFINCSGKNSYRLPPSVQTSHPKSSRHQPVVIGAPISTSTVEPKRPKKSRTSTPEVKKVPTQTPHSQPRVVSKAGESHFFKKFRLPRKIRESSGLLKVDSRLWTFNDSGGKPILYQIDERTGAILKEVKITNASNRDWEDIAFDDTYVYIGDIGNNRGNRKDLRVYKIPRASLKTEKSIRAEVIKFSFSDQKDFRSKPQQTNYDCEAMVAYHGKLYLFSKNWQDQKTRLYELTTKAGSHKAKYISTFNTRGMVTGATVNRELDMLLLSTYSSLLNVKIWAFTNYSGENFFNGASKALRFKSPMQGQVEGITFIDNYKAYLSSEAFKKYIFSLDSALYTLDFSGEFE